VQVVASAAKPAAAGAETTKPAPTQPTKPTETKK
jgi:hypothetical protein